MFGIGGSEVIIIGFVALLLFGPDKLPQMARTVGRFMREFKRYQAMMESTLKAEMYLAEQPAKKTGSDSFEKARAYRAKAGVTAPGETSPGASPAPIDLDSEEEAPIAPEDAGWVPGAPDAPGMPPVDDGEEAGEQL